MKKVKPGAISADSISTVFSLLNNNKQIGFTMDSFKNSSGIVKALMIVLLIMVGGSVGWFFLYHQIAPLMIVVAFTIPILCMGIAQQNKTILRILKEWGEYKTATDALIELIRVAHFDPETSEKVLQAIAWVEDESDDVDQIFLEIADTAQELLDAAKDAVASSTDGIIGNTSNVIKPNIIPKDETEDLSVTI